MCLIVLSELANRPRTIAAQRASCGSRSLAWRNVEYIEVPESGFIAWRRSARKIRLSIHMSSAIQATAISDAFIAMDVVRNIPRQRGFNHPKLDCANLHGANGWCTIDDKHQPTFAHPVFMQLCAEAGQCTNRR
jgi:hypothetical protein